MTERELFILRLIVLFFSGVCLMAGFDLDAVQTIGIVLGLWVINPITLEES